MTGNTGKERGMGRQVCKDRRRRKRRRYGWTEEGKVLRYVGISV